MEEKLVKESISGSTEAFCELYGLYKDRLYRYALYRLGSPDDAEDAVSECVLQAWKGISALRSPEAFGSWIFRILSASCAKQIKEAIAGRENLERIYGAGLGNIPADTQQAAELAEALTHLDDGERNIVLLSVIGGLSSKEIAEETGLTAGSVRSKLSRSLAKMREFLSRGDM